MIDGNAVDVLLQVDAGARVIPGHELVLDLHDDLLDGLGLENVGRHGVQLLELGEQAHHFLPFGLEFAHALSADFTEFRLGLDALVPAGEPLIELVALALEEAPLLDGSLAKHALFLDEFTDDLAAAICCEEAMGDVVEDGTVEHVDGDAMAFAGLFATAAEPAAVVVAILAALRVALAGRLELAGIPAATATEEPREEQGARRQPPRVLDGVALCPHLLGEIEQLLVEDGLDAHRDPFALGSRLTRAGITAPPVVSAYCGTLADDAEHQITRPQQLSVQQAGLVEVPRDRFGAATADVLGEDFLQELGFLPVDDELVLGAGGAHHLLDLETVGRSRAVEKALLGILCHTGACADPVRLALELVDELEHALGKAPIGVVRYPLLHRDHAHATPSQRLLVQARLGGIAHEARGVRDDDRANPGVRAQHLLEHALKLGAVVVGR